MLAVLLLKFCVQVCEIVMVKEKGHTFKGNNSDHETCCEIRSALTR